MKRLFLVFSILLANLAAFAGPIDDNCSTIYDSIIAGDISKAEDAASKVYAQKSACSATNLADLAIIYHQLVDKSSDAVTRYDYVLKTIDCYCGQRLERCTRTVHRKKGEHGCRGEKLQCQPVEIPAGGSRLNELLN